MYCEDPGPLQTNPSQLQAFAPIDAEDMGWLHPWSPRPLISPESYIWLAQWAPHHPGIPFLMISLNILTPTSLDLHFKFLA